LPLTNAAISIICGLAGAYTFFRLVKQRRSFIDRIVTEEDLRLAWMIAVFLLTPLGVLIHEAGHYLTAESYGATNVELHHRGYWGFVTYQSGPSFGTGKTVVVSLAGPGVSVLLGYLSLGLAAWLPTRIVFKYTLAFFGMVIVSHTLIGYPLIDLTSELKGDFYNIYTLVPIPEKIVVAAIHGLLLGLLVLSWKRVSNQLLLDKSGIRKITVMRNQV